MGEHIDWALLRPDMAPHGPAVAAVYGNSELSVREREAARWTIALINDCAVCRDTRARDGEASAPVSLLCRGDRLARRHGAQHTRTAGAEFAERFAIDHLAWTTSCGAACTSLLRGELADLTICCGCFLAWADAGLVGVRAPESASSSDSVGGPAVLGTPAAKSSMSWCATSSWYCTGVTS